MSSAATATTTYDDLDLSMVMAIVADGVGCEDDTHMVECSELVECSGGADGDLVYYTFSSAAVDALLAAGADDADQLGWLEIAAAPLSQDLTRELGGMWQAEAEVVADRVLVERTERLRAIGEAAARGPVGFSVEVEAAQIVAPDVLTVELVHLV